MNEPEPGLGVDAFGKPVIDPTKNVLDLVEAAVRRLDDLSKLREQHAREMRQAEKERIDAIRAVDVAASQQQQKDAEVRATALANTVAATAEANRSQVAAAATAAATSLAAALVPIQERLAELTRLQYEQQGQKQQVVESRAVGGSVGMWIGVGIAFIGLTISAVAITVSVYFATH